MLRSTAQQRGKSIKCPFHILYAVGIGKAGVATVAGTSFGAMGEGFIRFSYANSVENVERALDRFATLLSS